jgi:hypothetical protein
LKRALSHDSRLETLKKEAKRWLRALLYGDAEAVRRLRAALPEALAEPGLRDVQLALARDYGFAGWRALRAALDDTPRRLPGISPRPDGDSQPIPARPPAKAVRWTASRCCISPTRGCPAAICTRSNSRVCCWRMVRMRTRVSRTTGAIRSPS